MLRALAAMIALTLVACGNGLETTDGGVTRGGHCDDASLADVPPVPADAIADDSSNCPLIGCVDGVFVLVTDPNRRTFDTFHVDATVDGVHVSFDCDPTRLPQPMYCLGTQIGFLGTPRCIDLTVTLSDLRSFQARIVPQYGLYQPNGAGCPPVCRFAQADAVVQ